MFVCITQATLWYYNLSKKGKMYWDRFLFKNMVF